SYGYDDDGDVNSITYPNGQQISRTFTGDHQLKSVTDWLDNETDFNYDPDGPLDSEVLPNGDAESVTLDEQDQATGIAYSNASMDSDKPRFGRPDDDPDPEDLVTFDYDRDANEQVTSESDTGTGLADQTYGYNQLNQLDSINSTAPNLTYNGADDPTTLAT